MSKAAVDFFKANKEMSVRVSEFFRCVLHKAEIREIFSQLIAKAEADKAMYQNMVKDGTKLSVTKEELQQKITECDEQIAQLNQQCAEQIEAEAKFDYTKSDKKFRKDVKALDTEDTDRLKVFVRSWFLEYGLDIDGTTFEQAVIDSIGQKISVAKAVKTNGSDGMVWDATNALKNLYGVAHKYMVKAGTIKPAQIPAVLRDKYLSENK